MSHELQLQKLMSRVTVPGYVNNAGGGVGRGCGGN